MNNIRILLIFCFCSFVATSQELFTEIEDKSKISQSVATYYASEKFIETYYGFIDWGVLESKDVLLSIPGKESVHFYLEESAGVYKARNGTDNIILVRDKDNIEGHIVVDNTSYLLSSLKDNYVVIARVSFVKEEEPLIDNASSYTARQAYTPFVDNLSNAPLRVLVCYANNARNSVSSIYSHAVIAVETMNETLQNSAILHQVELAGVVSLNYNESTTSLDTDLERFYKKNDGQIDEVHKWRDVLSADVCVLIGKYTGGAGVATTIRADESLAFCVVDVDHASLNYTFAHEIGHLIGARHDVGRDNSRSPFPYGHGYISPNKNWRTVMAYSYHCNGCPRIAYWSNPRINHPVNRIPMGTTSLEDNARVLNEEMNRVKAFRNPPGLLTFTTSVNALGYAHVIASREIQTSGSVLLANNSQVVMNAPDRIILKPGFRAATGSVLQIAALNPTVARMQTRESGWDYMSGESNMNNQEKGLVLNCYRDGENVTVNYVVPRDSKIIISLLNLSGQKIKDVVPSEFHSVGEYQISFNTNLTSGMYYLIISDGKEKESVGFVVN